MNKQRDYLNYHLQLLKDLNSKACELAQASAFVDQSHQQIVEQLKTLTENPSDEAFYNLGQQCLCKIVAAWPQLTPLISRDLFWFFAGDCLQFMPDEEIAQFQALDEAWHQAQQNGENITYNDLKSKIFGLH